MPRYQPLLAALAILPMGAHGALQFGIGAAYYDAQFLHYTDKGYYQNFSTDLGLYSDFNKTHMAYLDVSLYRELANHPLKGRLITYAGLGGLFIKGAELYGDDHRLNDQDKNWGIRVPIGVELITTANFSAYAEVVPSYLITPTKAYRTTTTFGVRYYFD